MHGERAQGRPPPSLPLARRLRHLVVCRRLLQPVLLPVVGEGRSEGEELRVTLGGLPGCRPHPLCRLETLQALERALHPLHPVLPLLHLLPLLPLLPLLNLLWLHHHLRLPFLLSIRLLACRRAVRQPVCVEAARRAAEDERRSVVPGWSKAGK